MTDDGIGILLILVEEVCYTRECNLVDIFIDFLLCHTDTTVADSEGTSLLVERNANGSVTYLTLEVALGSKSLQLLCSIHSVGNHLTEEDVMI